MKKKILTVLIVLAVGLLAYAATEVDLKDGTGGGYYAKVNSDNQLLTKSVMISALQDASDRGDAYAWTAVSADIDATDTALLVANQSHTEELVIEYIYVWTDVATEIDIYLPAAATWAGTAVTGTCLNRTKNNTADAVAYADETGNTQANLIATLHTNETATDIFGVVYDLKGSVVLGYDDAIGVDLVSEPGAFDCTIVGYFR